MKKVLVVSEYAYSLRLLLWRIKLMGFRPMPAIDTRQALQKTIAEKPRLIIVEVLMPDMAGLKTIRALRKTSATRYIPIMALVPAFNSRDLQSCLESGCDAFLIKPFTFPNLEEKLNHLLGSDDEATQPPVDIIYRGHRIVWDAQPLPDSGSWAGRVAVVLPKYVDGIERVHRLGRSDTFHSAEHARHHLIGAAKRWIDKNAGIDPRDVELSGSQARR